MHKTHQGARSPAFRALSGELHLLLVWELRFAPGQARSHHGDLASKDNGAWRQRTGAWRQRTRRNIKHGRLRMTPAAWRGHSVAGDRRVRSRLHPSCAHLLREPRDSSLLVAAGHDDKSCSWRVEGGRCMSAVERVQRGWSAVPSRAPPETQPRRFRKRKPWISTSDVM